jgi:hypothetical protein
MHGDGASTASYAGLLDARQRDPHQRDPQSSKNSCCVLMQLGVDEEHRSNTSPEPPLTQPAPETASYACTLDIIIGFLLPFFLAAAGNADSAKDTIRQLIADYRPRTPTELDLVGRIIGFSIATLDNLRLSMTPGLSDTRVLRYRSNAVSLSRSSNQALRLLQAYQQGQKPASAVPRPSIAVAPTPSPPRSPVQPTALSPGSSATPTPDIERLKQEARIMMRAFSQHGAQPPSAIANPAAGIRSGGAGIPSPACLLALALPASHPATYRNPMLNQGTAATTIRPASTASR